jgi:hypothetical protein
MDMYEFSNTTCSSGMLHIFLTVVKNTEEAGGVAQVVEHLPSEYKSLNSNPNTQLPKSPMEDVPS